MIPRSYTLKIEAENYPETLINICETVPSGWITLVSTTLRFSEMSFREIRETVVFQKMGQVCAAVSLVSARSV
jgi:hypothetical protein